MSSRRRVVASLPGLLGLLGMLGGASCATAPPAGAPAEKVSAAAAAPSESTPPPSVPPVTQVGFETQILPILQAKCRPCHFEGGVMYTRLPFDCPQTVRFLGTKLFTRIKPEGEQSIINLFLAQSPDLDGETPKHCQIIGHN